MIIKLNSWIKFVQSKGPVPLIALANLAWCYSFADDAWRRNGKDDSYYVRSAIAF